MGFLEKCEKMNYSIPVYFANHIWFSFNIYHGTPILCCTTTDLGIFGAAFVRLLLGSKQIFCTTDNFL